MLVYIHVLVVWGTLALQDSTSVRVSIRDTRVDEVVQLTTDNAMSYAQPI